MVYKHLILGILLSTSVPSFAMEEEEIILDNQPLEPKIEGFKDIKHSCPENLTSDDLIKLKKYGFLKKDSLNFTVNPNAIDGKSIRSSAMLKETKGSTGALQCHYTQDGGSKRGKENTITLYQIPSPPQKTAASALEQLAVFYKIGPCYSYFRPETIKFCIINNYHKKEFHQKLIPVYKELLKNEKFKNNKTLSIIADENMYEDENNWQKVEKELNSDQFGQIYGYLKKYPEYPEIEKQILESFPEYKELSSGKWRFSSDVTAAIRVEGDTVSIIYGGKYAGTQGSGAGKWGHGLSYGEKAEGKSGEKLTKDFNSAPIKWLLECPESQCQANTYSAFKGMVKRFDQSWESMYKYIYDCAHSQGKEVKDLKFLVIGHSMGGGVANLSALRLATKIFHAKEMPPIQVVTFGGPAVLNQKLGMYYDTLLLPNTYTLITKGDSVPRQAQKITQYRLVGKLYENLDLGYDQGELEKLRLKLNKGKDWVPDPHNEKSYLQAIKAWGDQDREVTTEKGPGIFGKAVSGVKSLVTRIKSKLTEKGYSFIEDKEPDIYIEKMNREKERATYLKLTMKEWETRDPISLKDFLTFLNIDENRPVEEIDVQEIVKAANRYMGTKTFKHASYHYDDSYAEALKDFMNTTTQGTQARNKLEDFKPVDFLIKEAPKLINKK